MNILNNSVKRLQFCSELTNYIQINRKIIINSKNNQIILNLTQKKMSAYEQRQRTDGFVDIRRQSLKVSINHKQSQLLTYSSLGAAAAATSNTELPSINGDSQLDRVYPQIKVEQVPTEKKNDGFARQRQSVDQVQVKAGLDAGKKKKVLIVGGKFNGKIKIKKQPVERQVVEAQNEDLKVRNILISSRSQRHLDRMNRAEENISHHRSLKKVGSSRNIKLSSRKTSMRRHESLKSIIAKNPNLRIIKINGQESSDSDEDEETKKIKREAAAAAQEEFEQGQIRKSKLQKIAEREQRISDQKHVIEVRDLLHKSVYPDGHEGAIFRGRSKREIERHFQSIYYTNQLQPDQIPLPKVTSEDFRNLQLSLGTGRGRSAQLDSMKYTIRSQAYKGNKLISSRGQNLINLVSPLRSRQTSNNRPTTAQTGQSQAQQTSELLAKHEEQRPQSRKTSQRQDLDDQSTQNIQQLSLPEDSFEVYKNNLYQSHQQKETKKYVKRVLLEDIVYHKLMGQDEKILGMQKDADSEHCKMVLKMARRANLKSSKSNRASSAYYDNSDTPSKSITNSKQNNNYSDVSKSQAQHSSRRSKSIFQSRPGKSSHDGVSINDLIKDGARSQNPEQFYNPQGNNYMSGQKMRGASAKQDKPQDRTGGVPSKVERNASARLVKAANDGSLTDHRLNNEESIGQSQNQDNSIFQVSKDDGTADDYQNLYQTGDPNLMRNNRSFRTRQSAKDDFPSSNSFQGGLTGTKSHQGLAGDTSTPQNRNQSNSDRQGHTTSRSRNISEEQEAQKIDDDKDRPMVLTEEQKDVIRLIKIPLAGKNEEDIDFLYNYFNKFDFLQAQKKDKENKKKFNTGASQRQQQKQAQEMAKDQRSIEQMCRVTKHLFVEKGQTVFDYESQGDLFYMVVSGRVLCKIPFFKQMVLLSQTEKALFEVQFKEDILAIQEATELNKQLDLDDPQGEQKEQSKPKPRKSTKILQKGGIDVSKIQHFKNPYDLQPQQLLRYSREVLTRTHGIIANRKLKEMNQQEGAEGVSKKGQFIPDSGMASDNNDKSESEYSSSDEETKKRKQEEQQKQMNNPDYLAVIDPEYRALKEAFQNLLEDPESQQHRKYYQVNIMKLVKTYAEYGSFGELALITNKRRKAKLETQTDTHFAILSKEDYRQAQYKAQNQRLKEKILFLKNFDLFSMLSESQLSVLSYHMQEQLFYRGQIVYKEGIDPVDKIYLIRQGDFLLSKQLIRKVETYSAAEVLKDAQNVDLTESVALDDHSTVSTNTLFSYHKFKNLNTFRTFATSSRQSQAQEIEICILGDRDAFGYQELLEPDVLYRSCTVRCLHNQSPVVTIDKNALISIVRSNPKVLEQMKQKWAQFLVDRVSNKLFIEQVLEDAKEEQIQAESSPKKQKKKEQEIMELKRSMQKTEEESINRDPQKIIEDRMEKYNQNLPLMNQGDNESIFATNSIRNIMNERQNQPKVGPTFQYKSKLSSRIFNRPNDELLLQEYADDFNDRFYVDKGQQEQSKRAKSEKKIMLSIQPKGANLDVSFDELEKNWQRQKPTKVPPINQPYGAQNSTQDDKAALRTAQFGGGDNRGWPTVQSSYEENSRSGLQASPLRRPIFLHPMSGSSSAEHQVLLSKSELLLKSAIPPNKSASSSLVQAVIASDGTHHIVGDDITFHRSSALQAQKISTPATVQDLVDIDKSRQSAPIEMLGPNAFGMRNSYQQDDGSMHFRLDHSHQQHLSTDREMTHRHEEHSARHNIVSEKYPANFGDSQQQHRRTSQDVHFANQNRVEPVGGSQPPYASTYGGEEFANWTNITSGKKKKAAVVGGLQVQGQKEQLLQQQQQSSHKQTSESPASTQYQVNQQKNT